MFTLHLSYFPLNFISIISIKCYIKVILRIFCINYLYELSSFGNFSKACLFLACLHLSIHLSELQLFSFVIYCLQVEHEKC